MSEPVATTGLDSPFEAIDYTTLEGWRQAHQYSVTPPPLLTRRELEGLTSQQREQYLSAADRWHSELPALETPFVQSMSSNGRKFIRLNRGSQGGTRVGFIGSGPAGVGKTTALKLLGFSIETNFRRRHPNIPEAVPVVYITMPPARHPKALPTEFLNFLGAPYATRASETDLTHQACGLMKDLRTTLVLIDEIHKLQHTRAGHEQQSDQIKYFMDHIPATFVLGGIDVDTCGFFLGPRGRQLFSRFTLIRTAPFAYSSTRDRQRWRDLVMGFDSQLRLSHHRPGTLADHADYLYDRTSGYIVLLSRLVRSAALSALDDGSLRITRRHLDDIPINQPECPPAPPRGPDTPRPRRKKKAA